MFNDIENRRYWIVSEDEDTPKPLPRSGDIVVLKVIEQEEEFGGGLGNQARLEADAVERLRTQLPEGVSQYVRVSGRSTINEETLPSDATYLINTPAERGTRIGELVAKKRL